MASAAPMMSTGGASGFAASGFVTSGFDGIVGAAMGSVVGCIGVAGIAGNGMGNTRGLMIAYSASL